MEVIHKKPGAIGEGQQRALINSNVSGVEGQIGKFPSVPKGAGPMWSARTAGTASPGPPRFLSIIVNKANCGPLHHLIYYFNDYIPHCLAIVSLIDLIKFGLIKAGDI